MLRRNAPRVLVGVDAHVIDAFQRMAPESYQRVVTRVASGWVKKPA